MRTGLVLAPSGGVLGRLKPLFSLGLGARLGNGRQYMPWISLEDEVRALLFAISLKVPNVRCVFWVLSALVGMAGAIMVHALDVESQRAASLAACMA